MSVNMSRKLQEYSRTAEQTARDALVITHIWLVRHLTGKVTAHLPAGVDVENLESAGMLGLVEAASRFDVTRGVDFKSFAALRIRGAIYDEARRNCPLPQEVMQRVMLVAKAQEKLTAPVSVDDLVDETGLSKDDVLDALLAMPLIRIQSLDQAVDDPTRHTESSAEATAERAEQKRLLADAIAALPERERLVVTLYYMEDLRLKEIGEVLKLSESRVSRLLAAAQFQLRTQVGDERKRSHEMSDRIPKSLNATLHIPSSYLAIESFVQRKWLHVGGRPRSSSGISPTIELVTEANVVRAIDVTCACGQKMRLWCSYESTVTETRRARHDQCQFDPQLVLGFDESDVRWIEARRNCDERGGQRMNPQSIKQVWPLAVAVGDI